MKSVIKIGRSSTSDITVTHPAVSARHAELRKENDTYNLVDLSSSNGTFVNGERISSKELTEEDLVNFGPVAFIFRDGKLQLRSDLDEKEKPSKSPFDSIKQNKTGLLAVLVIVLLVVVGLQLFSSDDEKQVSSVVNDSETAPSVGVSSTKVTTTITNGEKTAAEIVSETFLLADYPWGVYNERTSRLQALLGLPPDGIYDFETRSAHIAALQGRGMSIETVPVVPSITTTTTTTTKPPPTVTSPGSVDWNDISRSVVFIWAYDCSKQGSGTVVLDGEYVLTNAHVISYNKYDTCEDLWIYAADSPNKDPKWIADGRVIPQAYDSIDDLAVIRLIDEDKKATRITDRKSIDIKNVESNFGDEIKIVGFPGTGGDKITISSGEHSGWFEDVDGGGDYYKSSARSGPGVSGGAAFDATTGDFIGVPSAGSLAEDVGAAFTLIRPNKYVLDVLQEAKDHG